MLNFESKISLPIGDKTYNVNFPNVGQMLEIENNKIVLSGNMYGSLVRSNHKTGTELLNLVDGVAYFSVLCKNFSKDFEIEKFTEMNVLNQKKISFAFVTIFWPWYVKIQSEIDKQMESEDDEKTTSQDEK
jgi:hypothetical protein